jgi:hypothetical protein
MGRFSLDCVPIIAQYTRTYDLCRFALSSRAVYELVSGVALSRFVTIRRLPDIEYTIAHIAKERPDASCLVYTDGAQYKNRPHDDVTMGRNYQLVTSSSLLENAVYVRKRNKYAEIRRYVMIMERRLVYDLHMGRPSSIEAVLLSAHTPNDDSRTYVYESDIADILDWLLEYQRDTNTETDDDGLTYCIISPPIRVPREYVLELTPGQWRHDRGSCISQNPPVSAVERFYRT